MAIDPKKFIVFRRKDLHAMLKRFESGSPSENLDAIEITDAVVIRLIDVHAAGALYSYASSLLATHEILSQTLGGDRVRTKEIRETMNNLMDIHEHFMTLADQASKFGDKNPTP